MKPGVQTAQCKFLNVFLWAHRTQTSRIKSWSGFSSHWKGTKADRVIQIKDDVHVTFRSCCSNRHFVGAKTVVFFTFGSCYRLLFVVTLQISLFPALLRPNWGLLRALFRKDGEERGACPVDIFYSFVPYVTLCFFRFLGNVWRPDHSRTWRVQTMVLLRSCLCCSSAFWDWM